MLTGGHRLGIILLSSYSEHFRKVAIAICAHGHVVHAHVSDHSARAVEFGQAIVMGAIRGDTISGSSGSNDSISGIPWDKGSWRRCTKMMDLL